MSETPSDIDRSEGESGVPGRPVTLDDRPVRRSDVLPRPVEGELVILDRRRSLIHRLNPTAAFIWQRCDGERTVGEIAAELSEAFAEVPDTLEIEVLAAVRQLEGIAVLERPVAGSGSSEVEKGPEEDPE